MKSIFALLFFYALSSQAYNGFRCVPSMRSTRIQVLVQEKQVEVLVSNPMGYTQMPQFESQGTVFLVSFNKMQGNDLIELADQFSFTWPIENCQVDKKLFTVSCRGEALNKVKSIQSFGVSTTEIIEKYDSDIYNKRRFRFTMLKDNTYFVSQEYDIKNCEAFN